MMDDRAQEQTVAQSAPTGVPASPPADGYQGQPTTSRVSLPSVSLPRGGGAISGLGEKFAVSAATGTCSLSLPLPFSPSRSGFGPDLTLSYDSGSGNGSFGFGWSVNLPTITRKTDKGMPQYADEEESDVYLLSGSEDLVPVLSADGTRGSVPRSLFGVPYKVSRYCPRVEGAYTWLERWQPVNAGRTFWRSISRDNVTGLFGYDPGSVVADPGNPAHIFAWHLSRKWDSRGNVVLFDYKLEDGVGVTSSAHEMNRTPQSRDAQSYLSSVCYGNISPYLPDWQSAEDAAVPTDWMFQAVFDYGEHAAQPPTPAADRAWTVRPDSFSSYRSGFEVRTYRRAHRILFFHNFPQEPTAGADRLVRSLDLTYADEQTPADPKAPLYSLIVSAAQTGYGNEAATQAIPPVCFTYSMPTLHMQGLTLDPDSLENLPQGLMGPRNRWIDLDGEGLNGILVEDERAWYYKRNRGANNLVLQQDGSVAARARFGSLETVANLPTNSKLAGTLNVFMDVSASGSLDLVTLDDERPGFTKRASDSSWEPFRPFHNMPGVDWSDLNLKFIDLTGDGIADVLLTEDGLFTFFPSLGEDGFDVARTVHTPWNEDKGPKLVLADGTETIFVADMTGDGLNDLVRVRNGEVSYWPNMGYGRFGGRIAMDAAPRFVTEEDFDPARIRLSDIDGSGTADLVYLAADGVRLWFNQSGNAWSAVNLIAVFPPVDSLASVQVIDLLGSGTACLVWSSPLPGESAAPLRYVDLMGGQKPHLLTGMANNLGAETRLIYVPSTRFYRDDVDAGHPWVTRLPFPVQVVARIETIDWIGRSRSIKRFSFHHGYFDAFEREFRGFGRVEQWDSEEFRDDIRFNDGPTENWEDDSWSPPVRTVSWFHTGAFLQAASVSQQYRGEYWGEPALKAAGTDTAMLLPDSVLPSGLDAYSLQETYRALKGHPLRVEVYVEDTNANDAIPYVVTEHNYSVVQVQPQGSNLHGVYRVDPRESLTMQYDRYHLPPAAPGLPEPCDPRISHDVTLECDRYGNPMRSVSVVYGRRDGLGAMVAGMPFATQSALSYDQQQLHVWATEQMYTKGTDDPAVDPDNYRAPLSWSTDTAELTGIAPGTSIGGATYLFQFCELEAHWNALWPGALDLPYENLDSTGIAGATGGAAPVLGRRMRMRTRTLFRANLLTGLLAPGTLESLALPGQSYRCVFTDGLLQAVFGATVGVPEMEEGGYLQLATETGWWAPSPLLFYSAGDNDTPTVELAQARTNFFLPRRSIDPFGGIARVDYDLYDLLTIATEDAVGNRITATFDYRVLQACMLTDANGNIASVAFDALERVTATALLGSSTEVSGDALTGFIVDLDDATLAAQLANPQANPAALLGNATTRTVYDQHAYQRTANSANPEPPVVYALGRETHGRDLAAGQTTQFQYRLSYSDGFGRTVQVKTLASPGPLVDGGASIVSRWTGSGWTVKNNKDQPIRVYEPFFSAASAFEFAPLTGVSSVMFYDGVGRVVFTMHPDNTWTKSVFKPWQADSWDTNDTVQTDPRADADIAVYFLRLIGTGSWTSWHDLRIAGTYGLTAEAQAAQLDAAKKTEAHGGTFTSSYTNSAGQACLTVLNNGDALFYQRTVNSLEGKPLVLFDALERKAQQFCLRAAAGPDYVTGYDQLGRLLYSISNDGNDVRTLTDVNGSVIRTWNARGFRTRTLYDTARRVTHRFISDDGATESLNDLVLYGEGMPTRNLCGRLFRRYDGSGLLENTSYDFKGNLLEGMRQFAVNAMSSTDWTALDGLKGVAALDAAGVTTGLFSGNAADLFRSSSRYDALNRAVQSVTPHTSAMSPNVLQPAFDQSTHMTTLDLWLQQAAVPPGLLDPTVADQHILTAATWNARGQQVTLAFGNGTGTVFSYDLNTFRLAQLTSTRPASVAAAAQTVQALSYFYDPMGNVTRIRDDADTQNVIFFRNQRVEPSTDYTYDPLYRLLVAHGREHLGQAGTALLPPAQVTGDDSFRSALLHPGDGNAMGTYIETYTYDPVGNMLAMLHATASGSWTRGYQYAVESWIDPAEGCNRLSGTTLPGDAVAGRFSATYTYDTHGNLTSMPSLPVMAWDADDRLQSTARGVINDGMPATTYNTYDSSGMRLRKTSTAQAAAGVKPSVTSQRLYLGAIEIYREFASDGSVTLERETLNVATGTASTTARVELRTTGEDRAPQMQVRYQYGNLLGSAVLELDEAASLVSYEEYFPYGSTSYQAVASATDVPKRYRFTGRERDAENDLYYHGARFYIPWLGRWTSCDPQGVQDGLNLYQYVSSNPVNLVDPTGMGGGAPSPEPLLSSLGSRVIGDYPGWNHLWNQAVNKAIGNKFGGTGTITQAAEQNIKAFEEHILGLVQTKGVGSNTLEGTARYEARKTYDAVRAQLGKLAKEAGVPLDGFQVHHGIGKVGELAQAPHKALDAGGLQLTKGNAGTRGTEHWRAHQLNEHPAVQPPAATASRDAAATTIKTTEQEAAHAGQTTAITTAKTAEHEALEVGAKEATSALEKSGGKQGIKLLGTKAAKFVPFLGVGVGIGLVTNDLHKGDYGSAAWDAAEAVPVLGDVVGAGHLGISAGELLHTVGGMDQIAAEDGARGETVARWLGAGDDVARVAGASAAALSAISVAPAVAIARAVRNLF
jgi:RHS repeat-associated protein